MTQIGLPSNETIAEHFLSERVSVHVPEKYSYEFC